MLLKECCFLLLLDHLINYSCILTHIPGGCLTVVITDTSDPKINLLVQCWMLDRC